MAKIVLDNLTKEFDNGFKAVNDVSLEVNEGEILVIVGPSGCGKTTILRMIAGLEDPTSGKISISGKEVNSVHPRNRDISMVFQNYALFPHLNVRENIIFGLKMRNFSKSDIDNKLDQVASLVNIQGTLDRKPGMISGGQRQRVALARAIIDTANIILLDEPMSNLDSQLRISTRAELKYLLKETGKTVVYVTHDQNEAMGLGDRICVIDHGKVQQIDTPECLYDNPINKFVAGFIGNQPMNFLNAQLHIEKENMYCTLEGHKIIIPNHTYSLASQKVDYFMGIRPDNLSLTPVNGQNENYLSGKIETVENFGDHYEISFRTQSRIVVKAKVARNSNIIFDNTDIKLYFDIHNLYIFSTDGNRLT